MYVATIQGKNYSFNHMPDFIRNPLMPLRRAFQLENNHLASVARKQAFEDMINLQNSGEM